MWLIQNLKLNAQEKWSYGQTFHCWKEKGHGWVSLKNAMKQSCDTYFYEVARLLGVDRLNITAEKFGLGKKVLGDYFDTEKNNIIKGA